MMGRACWAAVACAMVMTAAAQDPEEIHQLIGESYRNEDYAAVIRLVDAQVQLSQGTPWADSTYCYVYWYGRALRALKGPDAAAEGARRLVGIVERQGRAADHIKALMDLSWVYYELGRINDCLRTDSLAMAVADAAPEIGLVERGRTRQYLAFDYSLIGNYRAAARFAQAALDEYAKAEEVPAAHLAESYNALGASLWRMGRVREAETNYLKALDALGTDTTAKLLIRRAGTNGNLGVMWQDAGDQARSIAYYHNSLRDVERVLRTKQEPAVRDDAIMVRSRNYLNLATVYHALGDAGRAREYLELARAERSKILGPDDIQLLGLNERMADVELAEGNLDKAERLVMEYLRVWERDQGSKGDGYVRVMAKLARIALMRGMTDRADSLYGRGLEVGLAGSGEERNASLLDLYRGRADVRATEGKHLEAMADLGTARAIARDIGGEANYKVAQFDVLLAVQASAAGDQTGARQHALAAMAEVKDRVDALRRSSVPIQYPDPNILPDAIYCMVQAERAMDPKGRGSGKWDGDLDLAIHSLSRSRMGIDDPGSVLRMAASQQQLFNLALDDAFEAYDKNPSARKAERFFRLTEEDRTILLRSRLNTFVGLNYAGVPDSLLALEADLMNSMEGDGDDPDARADLDIRQQEYAELLRELEKDYPKYFKLRYGDQVATLGEVQEKLLTAKRQLLVYARTKEALYVMVVSHAATEVIKLDPAGLTDMVNGLRRAIDTRDMVAYADLAYRLHQLVMEPVMPLLMGDELLIIPDGELHSVNFELLLTSPGLSELREHFLIQRFAVAYLLSATTSLQFAGMNRERARNVLAMAPGFEDKLKQQYLEALPDTSMVDRSFLHYVRQPFAIRTAEALGRMLGAKVLTGNTATEGNFREMAGNSGIIFLGTHAEMDPARPMYSRLVLSKEGDGTNPDGYLHAYELYELDLRAQLAVLTACESGSGRLDVGEGIRSLGASFGYAGCPSLVVALWNIDEKVSAAIIEQFYSYLAQGLPKHEALRKAKLDYLAKAQDELVHPYYWAGLVLIGEVAPVQLGRPGMGGMVVGLLVLLGVLGGAMVVVYRRRTRPRI